MSTPISLSGFNNIDFRLILDAIMQQERVPVDSLQGQRRTLESRDSEYASLATK